MKEIALNEITSDQRLALVQALSDVGFSPVRGTHYGRGPHVSMPTSLSDADVSSGNVQLWKGWTHAGPYNASSWDVSDESYELVNGKEGDELIRNKTVKDAARDALKKAKDKENK